MKIRKRVKTSHIIAFSEIFFIGLTITTTLFFTIKTGKSSMRYNIYILVRLILSA